MLGERTMRLLVFSLALLGWAALLGTCWLGYRLGTIGYLLTSFGITVVWSALIRAMFKFCDRAFD